MEKPVLYLSHLHNPNLVKLALTYAEAVHGDQKRKYTGEPYVNHCRNVAAMVSCVTNDHHTITAAVLHDVIEDTDATFKDILFGFGARVASLVMEVTDVSSKADGNRKVRKQIDLAHLAKSSPAGATIKLADICDNSSDILAHDKDFAKIYLPEKAAMLGVLQHGDGDLWDKAASILERGLQALKLPADLMPKKTAPQLSRAAL